MWLTADRFHGVMLRHKSPKMSHNWRRLQCLWMHLKRRSPSECLTWVHVVLELSESSDRHVVNVGTVANKWCIYEGCIYLFAIRWDFWFCLGSALLANTLQFLHRFQCTSLTVNLKRVGLFIKEVWVSFFWFHPVAESNLRARLWTTAPVLFSLLKSKFHHSVLPFFGISSGQLS